MSDRPISRRQRSQTDPHPSQVDEVAVSAPLNAQETTSLAVTPTATRSGDDTRRRGWFWHWNSIVTQYAPLIGLKGVGLLNSYTVWTDRREESPHRGFAFPSQQSEADFYGEDRAELITINKILVALDLIEIRKEMVLRVDEQGRRWKVPHNFYRVKDHSDGSSLTSRDVLKVAELADRDQTVYRYVRRVFSPRFSAIDRDNVWVSILDEVRQADVWQRLAAKALKDETRASDRTRAGHAARKSAFLLPESGDNPTPQATVNDSGGDRKSRRSTTSVEPTNNGFEADVAPINNGLTSDSETFVDQTNDGDSTDVDQTNRTYNEYLLTTTTTTGTGSKRRDSGTKPGYLDGGETGSHRPVTGRENLVTGVAGNGPAGQTAPSDLPGENRAVQAFEDANGRRATVAERTLLRRLSERFDSCARSRGTPELATGWDWVTAGIYEAVEAGSTFVAPRRLREILSRWERDGLPGMENRDDPPPFTQRGSDHTERQAPLVDAHVPGFDLPHGFSSRKTWEFTVSLLGVALEASRLAELVDGSAIVGYRDDEVTISVPRFAQAERMCGEYKELVERKLSEAMRRPVRLAVLVSEPIDVEQRPNQKVQDRVTVESDPETPIFIVPECGLPSTQVWAAVIDEVIAIGDVSRANVDTWLRSTRLIGRGPGGSLIVGTAHALAQRRIESRFASPLATAAAAIVGAERPLEFVIARDWLMSNHYLFEEQAPDEAGVA